MVNRYGGREPMRSDDTGHYLGNWVDPQKWLGKLTLGDARDPQGEGVAEFFLPSIPVTPANDVARMLRIYPHEVRLGRVEPWKGKYLFPLEFNQVEYFT